MTAIEVPLVPGMKGETTPADAIRTGAGTETSTPRRLWHGLALAYAVIVALSLAYFVVGSPIQLSEALRNMLAVQRTGLWDLLVTQFTQGGFLRPLLMAQIDVPFELAGGQYHLVFKTIHATQIVLTAVLFVMLLRVRTGVDLLAATFGVAALFGTHTFAGTVTEGFPINTFLTIVVCCLLAANLAHGEPAVWRDVAGTALFVWAALTVETGLLVWVVFAAGAIAGFRGISRRGVAVMTALLAGYMALRFGPLHVGAPALVERSSGFGFHVLDPPELIARFGVQPAWFYLYNVVTQVVSVLFAEPKAGVWVLARDITAAEVRPRDVIAVAVATGTTLLIVGHAVSRVAAWRQRHVTDGDRWLLVALAVLAANAVTSYPYTKTVIMSPAGVFYAVAAAVTYRAALHRLARPDAARVTTLGLALVLTALSAGWAVRQTGLHYRLREKAFVARNDWMFVQIGHGQADVDVQRYPEAGRLIEQLRHDALVRRVPSPAFDSPIASAIFEDAW